MNETRGGTERAFRKFLPILVLALSLAFSGCGGGGGGGNEVSSLRKTELTPGTNAPEIQVPTWLNSETMSLANQSGKYVLIEFCLSTCQACKDAIPLMANIYGTFQKRGLTVVALSYEQVEVLQKCAASYPAVVWPIGASSTSWLDYGVVSFPHCFVVNPAGVIAWEGKPTAELKTYLEGRIPVN